MAPCEIIVAVEVSRSPAFKRSDYLKVRHRASDEFAAASAAIGVELANDGHTMRDVRIAVSGVATKP